MMASAASRICSRRACATSDNPSVESLRQGICGSCSPSHTFAARGLSSIRKAANFRSDAECSTSGASLQNRLIGLVRLNNPRPTGLEGQYLPEVWLVSGWKQLFWDGGSPAGEY